MGKRISSGNIGTLTNVRETLQPGEVLTDLTGKKWITGEPIGVGGFGEIYLVSDVLNEEVANDSPYVAKIESHSNGPLFVEINCYLRIARQQMIEEWQQQHQLNSLGMPHYVASGSHLYKGIRYRFLILPRYETDLESVLQEKKRFNLKTVVTVSLQIIDILEYIHSKGYVHSDIKGSNILLGCTKQKVMKKPVFCYRTCNPVRKCRMQKVRPIRNSRSNISYLDDIPDFGEFEKLMLMGEDEVDEWKKFKRSLEIDQVYLLDYGLASKYRTLSNVHKPYCVDERKAHMGTMLFCSRDAHKGAQSRRSDLECLAYNMVYWLSGFLPWQEDLQDANLVDEKKQRCMDNVIVFLKRCLGDYPIFLLDFFEYLKKLTFEEKPDYGFCKKLFRKALKDYGYKNNNKFDFNNLEGWGEKRLMVRRQSENRRQQLLMSTSTRLPLHSNFPVKSPKRLRRKFDKELACLKWSKILIDPEIIIKKQKRNRERKLTESSDLSMSASIFDMDDISKLNPTYAMVEVFSKSKARALNGSFGSISPQHKPESEMTHVDGYTPAMMAILARMKKNQQRIKNIGDDSEEEYFYKFPKPKKSAYKSKRKTGTKRKATVAALYSTPRTRDLKLMNSEKTLMPPKKTYRLRQ